jgi:hypothetical protein
MTTKAYEIFPTWSEIPVTIFAHDADEAERLFREWVGAHFRHQPATIESIYPFAGDALAARPRLAQGAALDVSGIAYWDLRKHAWTIAQPQDEPCGDLASPEGNAGYYFVKADEGDDAKIFATSFEEATNLYCAWHLDRWGELPERFYIQKGSRWELTGGLATLRDDLENVITGVAAVDNDGVWRVLPPDWEPSYTKQ